MGARKKPCPPSDGSPSSGAFQWAVGIRRVTSSPAESRRSYFQGVETLRSESLFVAVDVPVHRLPARLRALADYYDGLRSFPGDEDEADIVICHRRRR